VRAEETQFADVAILKVAGRVDQETSLALQQTLQQLIGRVGAPSLVGLVIDFSGVPYMSSAGLRALMVGAKECKAKGGKLAIAGLQPVVREVFQISRFDKVIATFGPVHEALGSVSPAAAAAFNAQHPA
jgi:anti-anti-sigma factor